MGGGMTPDPLLTLLDHATERRKSLRDRLRAEETDTWRLFNGTTEGWPGLTIDRYGQHVLVQTSREPLDKSQIAALETHFGLPIAWNHRGRSPAPDRIVPEWARAKTPFIELGVRYEAPMVHRGLDPWLFLDLRPARRWLQNHAQDKTVLNTFAYTGGAGLAVHRGGARQVTQLDHGNWCSHAAEELAALNGFERVEVIQGDFFEALRQFSGLGLKGRAARNGHRHFSKRHFDLIVLDPPTFSRGPFGAVDIIRDYASLAKPCLLSLNPGGALLATNHSAKVGLDEWTGQVARCAEKAGCPISRVTVIPPADDFPTPDGRQPLKVAVFEVGDGAA